MAYELTSNNDEILLHPYVLDISHFWCNILQCAYISGRISPACYVSRGRDFERDRLLGFIYFNMPTDTKRVRGPEVSQSPSLFSCDPAAVLPSKGPRADGRRRDQVDVRPVFVRCGLVSQAKGSAYLEAGNTKLMCCVYGPRETDRKDETNMKCGRYGVCLFKSLSILTVLTTQQTKK